jgi:serine/threonine protein kinase
MAAPVSVPDFLTVLRKSALVPSERLDAFLGSLRESGPTPDQPRAFAARLVQDNLLTRFQAEQLLRGKSRGFNIGKYLVLDQIGAGGMGAVFLCEHVRMGRRVALKVLPVDRAKDPGSLARFRREAQAAAALDHPNIVRAYDVGEDRDLHFLVMEYVEGVDLQALVTRVGPLDPLTAANYVGQAANGLDHACRAGMVHRDIKPANLLVSKAGVVKILDMGLARLFGHTGEAITAKMDDDHVLGTADYLSPEQARDSSGVDTRADIYSLGATFYFLLTGKAPFADGTLHQKLLFHQTRAPRPVHEVRPEVPTELSEIVARMLAKEPADRFQSPADLLRALAPWARAAVPPPESGLMPPPVGEVLTNPPATVESAHTTQIDLLPTSSEPDDAWGGIIDTALDQPAIPVAPDRATGSRLPAWAWAVFGVLIVFGGAGVFWWLVRPTRPAAPAHTAPEALKAPARLHAARAAKGIELTWQMPHGQELGFKIERANDLNFQEGRFVLATTPSGVSRYADATAEPGKSYFYRVRATNGEIDSPSTNLAWLPPDYSRGFTADGVSLNGSSVLAETALRLTDGQNNQAGSAFYHMPLDVRSFRTAFRFRVAGGADTADGFTFCLQNAGPKSVGVGAGGLGYQGVVRSIALKFDLWNNDGEGPNSTGLYRGGQAPASQNSVDLTDTGIDLHSGRVYDVQLTYDGKHLILTITDTEEPAKKFRREFAVDIRQEVGAPTAYAGFTAGTGGLSAVQEILTWSWEQRNGP